jgi:hypothetical protein
MTIPWARVALAGAILLAAAAIVVLLARPASVVGPGTLYKHLWCLGVKFDSGVAYPVGQWPQGLHVTTPATDGLAGLVNDAGAVVFAEGDRVFVTAFPRHGSGDTACANLNDLYVETITKLAEGSVPP